VESGPSAFGRQGAVSRRSCRPVLMSATDQLRPFLCDCSNIRWRRNGPFAR
jgi:hypothetical protein